MLGVTLFKIVSLDARLRGAWVSFDDARCADGVDTTILPGCDQNPSEDGWDISTEFKLTYDRRANWYGITTGNMLGVSYEVGQPSLGSDFDYWVVFVKAIHARKFFEEHNLVLKASATYGYHLPFQQELATGGTNLRGYRNMQFRGDSRVWGVAEYSVPFFKAGPLAFRGLVFADAAYTTFINNEGNDQRHYLPGQTDVEAGQFRLGVGGGFRIYVRSVVMPLLGIDVGYGPQADTYYMYFAVGLTEL
jgi:outer membrane protein assembly factor BamA